MNNLKAKLDVYDVILGKQEYLAGGVSNDDWCDRMACSPRAFIRALPWPTYSIFHMERSYSKNWGTNCWKIDRMWQGERPFLNRYCCGQITHQPTSQVVEGYHCEAFVARSQSQSLISCKKDSALTSSIRRHLCKMYIRLYK